MSWQPSASLDALKARAQFNTYIRDFFALRDVLEVETPVLQPIPGGAAARPQGSPRAGYQRACPRQGTFSHYSPGGG